ncbi:serine hydrolase [Streptomyces sp. NPDC029674]|uniref:serine hydrolase n=1 Tax=Streptomyces sp. NPDC029674 TaxID=3365297 RepID=UPI00384C795E
MPCSFDVTATVPVGAYAARPRAGTTGGTRGSATTGDPGSRRRGGEGGGERGTRRCRASRPLRLTGTSLPLGADPTLPTPHARHYTKLFSSDPDAPVHDVTELETTPYWAAGGMISTLTDLTRFFAALLGGQLLRPEQQREMFTMVQTANWLPRSTYGLGVSRLTLPSGTAVWGMGGALFGSWTYVYGTRDGTHLLAVDTNADWTTGRWEDPIGIFTDLLEAEFSYGCALGFASP